MLNRGMTLKTKASIPRTPKTATRTIWETGGKVLRVLDVGCGPGIYVAALAQQGLDAHGVDVDPATPYERVDVFSDDFARHYDGYDLCLCLEVAEHLPEAKSDGLLDTLCASIASHIKHNWKHEYPYQFTQIKEKFGGLRVYDTGHDDTIFGMICMAEAMSHQICELCGHPARVCSSGYWLRTLCPACAEKHNYTCRIPEEEEPSP